MATTKEKILSQAERLFNEEGYNNVSLRDIAEAAGTTIGNLTYHFPQKENLVFAIQSELYTEFLHNFVDQQDGLLTFENMINSFLRINENRKKNAFFYRNIVELCQESSAIASSVDTFRQKIYQYYLSSFLNLQQEEILRNDISTKQYETLAYTVVYLSGMWWQNTTQYYDESIPRIELHTALKDLIYPYLTKKGMSIFSSF